MSTSILDFELVACASVARSGAKSRALCKAFWVHINSHHKGYEKIARWL